MTDWIYVPCRLTPNRRTRTWAQARRAYTTLFGFPKGQLNHCCDNGLCWEPLHLYDGTQSQNLEDSYARGRQPNRNFGSSNGAYTQPQSRPKGSRHGNSILTEEQVVAMRTKYAEGGVTYKQLAQLFGVRPITVETVVRRKSWKHV